MLTLTLLGCIIGGKEDSGSPDTGAGDDTGGGGTGGDAWGCVEIEVTPITDTTVAAGDLAFAPDDAVVAWAGTWQGTFTFTAGNTELAAFSLDPAGTWELVERELQGGDDTTMSTAPAEECRDSYRWTTTFEVSDASGAFEEVTQGLLELEDLDAAELAVNIPIEVVVGTTRPSWDPADWAYNGLVFSGTGTPGSWSVSVLWQGVNPDFASGTVDTATVEPSGVSESVAYGEFVPLED